MVESYDQKRSRRRLPVRAATVSMRRLTKRERSLNELLAGDVNHERPRTRGECLGMERPCPFVGCRHHLFLDVTATGNIKFNFPDRELDDMPETCALDVADQDGLTLEDVGELLNVTRERVRMIEVEALSKVLHRRELDEDAEGDRDENTRRAFAREPAA